MGFSRADEHAESPVSLSVCVYIFTCIRISCHALKSSIRPICEVVGHPDEELSEDEAEDGEALDDDEDAEPLDDDAEEDADHD